MNILYILPHKRITGGFFYTFGTYPSLTLIQLAAITPKEHAVELIDERFQRVNFKKNYDLVGISALTYNAYRAYEIADAFRHRGIPVVLGGYHPSALPKEAKQHADAVVIGEAESCLPVLLDDIAKRQLKPFYFAQKKVASEDIPPAAHNVSSKMPFIESIQATRGCPIGCEFCSIHTIEGNILRKRPINRVIDEIKSIRKKHLFFADASLTISPEYSKSLFTNMKETNKTFDCCGNINVLSRDDKLLELASEAGCQLIQVGFESISQDTIDAAGKQTNKIEDYDKAVKRIQDHGIMIMGLFIFGFDQETPKIFRKTLDAIHRWELDRVFFSILTPYPGTPIFEKLIREGRIVVRTWDRYNNMDVVFQPKHMSPAELSFETQRLINKYYSFSNSLKRSFNDKDLSFNRFTTRIIRDMSARHYYKIIGRL